MSLKTPRVLQGSQFVPLYFETERLCLPLQKTAFPSSQPSFVTGRGHNRRMFSLLLKRLMKFVMPVSLPRAGALRTWSLSINRRQLHRFPPRPTSTQRWVEMSRQKPARVWRQVCWPKRATAVTTAPAQREINRIRKRATCKCVVLCRS